MIKNIEKFMELDSLREEMKASQEAYQEVADSAYSKAAICGEEDNLIVYGVWMDVVEMCNWYLDIIYDDIKKIEEELQELVEEA